MMDAYYKLRELDKTLQKYFQFEGENDLDEEAKTEQLDRRHECILEIAELLQFLGLPSTDVQAYIREKNLTQSSKASVKPSTGTSDKKKGVSKKGSVQKLESSATKFHQKEIDKANQTAVALLTDEQKGSLKRYGVYRPSESKAERANSLPSRAELALMLVKSYQIAETESRKNVKEKGAKKSAGKKKGDKDKSGSGIKTPTK